MKGEIGFLVISQVKQSSIMICVLQNMENRIDKDLTPRQFPSFQ